MCTEMSRLFLSVNKYHKYSYKKNKEAFCYKCVQEHLLYFYQSINIIHIVAIKIKKRLIIMYRNVSFIFVSQ